MLSTLGLITHIATISATVIVPSITYHHPQPRRWVALQEIVIISWIPKLVSTCLDVKYITEDDPTGLKMEDDTFRGKQWNKVKKLSKNVKIGWRLQGLQGKGYFNENEVNIDFFSSLRCRGEQLSFLQHGVSQNFPGKSWFTWFKAGLLWEVETGSDLHSFCLGFYFPFCLQIHVAVVIPGAGGLLCLYSSIQSSITSHSQRSRHMTVDTWDGLRFT